MSTTPRTVAVIGSPITLDSFETRFNPDYRRWYEVVATDLVAALALIAPPNIVILDFLGDARSGDAALVAERFANARVIVHRVPEPTPLTEQLEDQAVERYGWDVIDLRAERVTATGDYHHRFLAELHALDLQARLSPDLADQVAAVAAASRDRNVRQARFVKAATEELEEQIRAWEQRSVTAAVRAAITGRRR